MRRNHSQEYGIAILPRHRGNVHPGGVIERLLGTLNGVIGALPGRTGRSVADRDGYASQARARLTFGDLERCVALAILDHNSHQNAKTLIVPISEWRTHSAGLPRRDDDLFQVLIAFLPGGVRRLTPQGVSVNALGYYAPWLGELVPERDRLGPLEVRADPRDISHVYVRHPRTKIFLAVARRDGRSEPVTLWQHARERTTQRAAPGQTPEMKVARRRAISAIVKAAEAPAKPAPRGAPQKSALREATRAAHAHGAEKPWHSMTLEEAPPQRRLPRARRPLPVEPW